MILKTPVLRLTALLLLVVCLLSFAACNEAVEVIGGIRTADGLVQPDYVVRFGSYSVSFPHYRYLYLSQRDELAGEDENYFETYPHMEEALKESVFLYCRYLAGFYHLLSQYNVYLTADEYEAVDERIANIRENYEKAGGNFKEMLAKVYLTEELYCQLIEEEELETKLHNTLFLEDGAPFSLKDEEVVSYVKKNFVLVRHIYCDTKEEADAAAKALAEGETFASVLNRYNQDATMEDNTEGSYYAKGAMTAAYEEVAFALQEGETSSVVETAEGWYIIRRMAMSDDFLRADVTNMRNRVYSAEYDRLLSEAIADITPVCCSVYEDIAPDSVK